MSTYQGTNTFSPFQQISFISTMVTKPTCIIAMIFPAQDPQISIRKNCCYFVHIPEYSRIMARMISTSDSGLILKQINDIHM